MRLARAGLVAMLVAGAATFAAAAHAELLDASPGPGEQVPQPVSTLVLTFDQPVLLPSQVQLITHDFQPVPGVESLVDGPRIVAQVNPALNAGDYTVLWTAVSGDGHTTAGSYQFGVIPAPGSSPSAAGWIAGALVGAALLVGLVMWRRRPPAGPAG